jgi:hypothetical protein
MRCCVWLPKIFAHSDEPSSDLARVAAHVREHRGLQQFGPLAWERHEVKYKYPCEHFGRHNGNRRERLCGA